MRHPPPAGVTCSDGGAWRAARCALAALAGGVFVAWALLQLRQPPHWAAAVGLAAATLATALAFRATREPLRTLRWDGQRWAADGTPGEVDLMLDLGGWLLLRFRAGGARGALWLPVSAATAGAAWHALRAALYSHAMPEAATDGLHG